MSPLVKLQFDPIFLKVFIVLSGIVLIALWVALPWLFPSWSSGASLPISSFLAMDFLFKAVVVEPAVDQGGSVAAKRARTSESVNGVMVFTAVSSSEDSEGSARKRTAVVHGDGE